VTVELSYRVNFTGNPEKWFDLENYVKVLTDHCRSKLRNLAKRHEFQDFYDNTIDLIRDQLLGKVGAEKEDGEQGSKSVEVAPRSGMRFDDNGMHLYEIEVLGVKVNNNEIEKLTRQASYNALEGAIRLSEAEIQARQQARHEELTRTNLDEKDKTRVRENQFTLDTLARGLQQRLTEVGNELQATQEGQAVSALRRAEEALDADQVLQVERAEAALQLEALRGQVEQYIARTNAVSPELVKALTVFGDQRFTEQIVAALGPIAATLGLNTAYLLHQTFKGTAAEGIMGALTERPYALATSNGND